ncbi:MAG: 3'-5' exoribonuclease YhaM family protein [Planctomycetota bacterium]
MSHRFISDLRAGEQIEHQVFLVRSKDLRTTTQGSLYIHAVLMDKSGQLVARMWQASRDIFKFLPEGGFVALKGRVEAYKGNPQFIIEAVRPAEPDSYDVSDFMAATERNIDEMWNRLTEILGGIENPEISALIQAFLEDKAFVSSFRKAPAAAVMHHAYVGGLLEHTLNLLEIAQRVIPLYPQLNLDLVLAGLFLHDVGKTKELTYEAAIGYSDEGQLIGHITQGVLMLGEKARQVEASQGKAVTERLLWSLQHIILSHHGRYEFGSPKLPAMPEAIAIHYLDNLDAKINMFVGEIASDRDPEAHWTNFNRAIETKVFKLDPTGAENKQEQD